MKNLCILLLFVLSIFTYVNASNCNLKSFTVDTSLPSDATNYALSVHNLGEYNVLVVPGTTWGFLIDSSLKVPSLSIKVDEQKKTIDMIVDEFNPTYVKTAGSSRMAPSLMVLISGLALVFGGKDKKALFFLGLFLCFAATSVMAFDACNTIVITYPQEMKSFECVGCESVNRVNHRSLDARDACAPVATSAPATQAPVTQAPATQAPATQAPATQAPATKAPATQAPVTQAPSTQAPPASATSKPVSTQAPPASATSKPIVVTQAPATQAPATQAPATQAPATQAPYVPSGSFTCQNYIQSAPSQYYNNARMCTTTRLPYTLALSSDIPTLEAQVAEIMALSSYNDPTVYSPDPSATFADYHASFYPADRLYNNNPTQTFIGLSDITFGMNMIETKLRLPSIYFGMFLAYTMDHFGINPHFLLAQAGKEAAATMSSPTFTKNFFTCDNSQIATGGCSGQVYDCRATYDVGDTAIQGVTHQGCPAVDNFGIALGPFQIETEGFAQVVSVAPQRFWVETATRTAANTNPKTPLYMDSGVIALQSTNVKQLQANYTSHNSDSLAIVGAGIYHHWVYNVLLQFPQANFRSAFDSRTTSQKDELTFATILYLYNRGMYSPLNFDTCKPTDDPTSSPNCVSSLGFGAYAAQIKNATFSLDHAPNVYDFPIQWSDVQFFIQQLQLSYPYQCASCDFGGAYGNINWASLNAEAYKIYQKLAAARATRYSAQVQTGISFRYDWRLMQAVIRAFLPGRDIIAGPDFAPWSYRAGGDGVLLMASDPGPYAAAPFGGKSWAAPAGQKSAAMPACSGTCPAGSFADQMAAAASAPAVTSAPASNSASNAAAKSCPISDGTICSAQCSSTWYQCSGGTAYGNQNVPVGTKCYNGQFILATDSRCPSS